MESDTKALNCDTGVAPLTVTQKHGRQNKRCSAGIVRPVRVEALNPADCLPRTEECG
jgi:hypothetical protein